MSWRLFSRGMAIELSNEFSTLGILLGLRKLIIDNAIMDVISSRWTASDKGKTAKKIKPRLDKRLAVPLLKLQRGRLSTVMRIIRQHCIIGTHARRIGPGNLANDFCNSCGDEEEE